MKPAAASTATKKKDTTAAASTTTDTKKQPAARAKMTPYKAKDLVPIVCRASGDCKESVLVEQ